MITFAEPVQIAWDGLNLEFGTFISDTVAQARALHDALGELRVEPISAGEDDGWTGYLLRSVKEPHKHAWILASTGAHPVRVTVSRRDLGIEEFSCELPPCGRAGCRVVKFTD